MSFKQQAREKFQYASINGDGGYAVIRKDHPRWSVFLYTTRQRAERAIARRSAHFIVELDAPYVPASVPLAPTTGIDWDAAD